jgi:putative tryptophan/tyrosine transport system substrate-binding protein
MRPRQSRSSSPPVSNPVGSGLIASLARPGGNLTDVTNLNVQLWQKRIELIAELVPQAQVIGLLQNPNNAQVEDATDSAQQAAATKGLQLELLRAGTEAEIDAAFATAVERHVGAVVVGDPLFDSRRERIVALAAHYAIPCVYIRRDYVAAGGLISYGAIFTAAYHQVGIYAGKILNGARPADLPVHQSTNFELVINLNTAKALGLTVPPSILARADEVIE